MEDTNKLIEIERETRQKLTSYREIRKSFLRELRIKEFEEKLARALASRS